MQFLVKLWPHLSVVVNLFMLSLTITCLITLASNLYAKLMGCFLNIGEEDSGNYLSKVGLFFTNPIAIMFSWIIPVLTGSFILGHLMELLLAVLTLYITNNFCNYIYLGFIAINFLAGLVKLKQTDKCSQISSRMLSKQAATYKILSVPPVIQLVSLYILDNTSTERPFISDSEVSFALFKSIFFMVLLANIVGYFTSNFNSLFDCYSQMFLLKYLYISTSWFLTSINKILIV